MLCGVQDPADVLEGEVELGSLARVADPVEVLVGHHGAEAEAGGSEAGVERGAGVGAGDGEAARGAAVEGTEDVVQVGRVEEIEAALGDADLGDVGEAVTFEFEGSAIGVDGLEGAAA